VPVRCRDDEEAAGASADQDLGRTVGVVPHDAGDKAVDRLEATDHSDLLDVGHAAVEAVEK
jgi:hypothetical protein